jgi:cyclopropane fatty-acyl-phospholipid synthase-like methyltransferase
MESQLLKVIKEKKIPIHYPRGYQEWEKKFNQALRETKGDVLKALTKLHQGNYPQSR